MSTLSFLHPKTRTSRTNHVTRRSLHTPEIDGLIAEKRAAKAREPKTCFICGEVALFQDYRGKKGSCRAHRQQLMEVMQ